LARRLDGLQMVVKRNIPVHARNRTLIIQSIASCFATELPGFLTVIKSGMRKAEIRDVRFSWQ
jgi:hypothetical protein